MTIPEPTPGAMVHDTRQDRVGVVTGRVGPRLRLRPPGGGRAWDAVPEDIRLMTPAEVLRARLAEVNARSRKPTR